MSEKRHPERLWIQSMEQHVGGYARQVVPGPGEFDWAEREYVRADLARNPHEEVIDAIGPMVDPSVESRAAVAAQFWEKVTPLVSKARLEEAEGLLREAVDLIEDFVSASELPGEHCEIEQMVPLARAFLHCPEIRAATRDEES